MHEYPIIIFAALLAFVFGIFSQLAERSPYLSDGLCDRRSLRFMAVCRRARRDGSKDYLGKSEKQKDQCALNQNASCLEEKHCSTRLMSSSRRSSPLRPTLRP